ncbi:WAT1-related protein At4g30420-like [Tripterygium wilfordii]|uniref:WAT1-related protein At4g30420-like n=1 Tax=Tripterygium wilfordii TaxID=458696 RepID=UPI0018F8268A|nr:WAT1-related protein At4g30420-like [Tripterygium wilfordii]
MGWLDAYSKPVMALVALQTTYAGVTLLAKAAFSDGLKPMVYLVYRAAIATLFMAPIAYFSSRSSTVHVSLGFRSFFWLFVASLFGTVCNQVTYFSGLKLSSPTVASTTVNLIPAVTFVLATIAGLEKINIRSIRSIAKIGGTIVCVGGAISVASLKGPKILNTEFVPLNSSFGIGGDTWLIGCLLLFMSNFCWSVWLIVQVKVTANCPDHLVATFWICFMGLLQMAVLSLFIEPDIQAYKLHSNIEYICCLFAGMASVVSVFGQSWCISQRGPLFCAMFNPLSTVIVAILAAIFLHDQIYIGSLAGAIAVITGLYVVLWGKAEDIKVIKQEKADPEIQNDQRSTSQGPSYEPPERNVVEDLKEPLITHIR